MDSVGQFLLKMMFREMSEWGEKKISKRIFPMDDAMPHKTQNTHTHHTHTEKDNFKKG